MKREIALPGGGLEYHTPVTLFRQFGGGGAKGLSSRLIPDQDMNASTVRTGDIILNADHAKVGN